MLSEKTILKICNIIVSIAFAICFAFTINYVFLFQVKQQGFSMAPYINDRSVVFVNRLYRNVFKLKRHDVIAFYTNGQTSLKRIYGMPGETVVITNGEFYIDGEKLTDENLKKSLSSNIEQNVTVKDNEYYVLGDNLDSSKDSRFVDVGNVKKEDIIGKVWLILKQK